MNSSNKKINPSRRFLARLAAVQAIYLLEYTNDSPAKVIRDFSEGKIGREVLAEDIDTEYEEFIKIGEFDKPLMTSIINGVYENKEALDVTIQANLSEEWAEERLEKIITALLRCGLYEIFYRTDIPPKVTISEYTNIAYSFYQDAEPKMLNALLDSVAKKERAEDF